MCILFKQEDFSEAFQNAWQLIIKTDHFLFSQLNEYQEFPEELLLLNHEQLCFHSSAYFLLHLPSNSSLFIKFKELIFFYFSNLIRFFLV